MHAYKGYIRRMLKDPVMFVILFHIFATFVHFITWASSYGGVNGGGPTSNIRVAEFDDVVMSMVGLSGWLSLLYFARGYQPLGQLVVLLEMSLISVGKWLFVYVLLNFGFTLAFYACMFGTTYSMAPARWAIPGADGFSPLNPMKNIGYDHTGIRHCSDMLSCECPMPPTSAYF